MTMAYLNGWQGPVTEEEDPYGDGYSPGNLSPAVHVQEIQLLDGADRQEIKEAVQKYGAVQTSLYMSRETVYRKQVIIMNGQQLIMTRRRRLRTTKF